MQAHTRLLLIEENRAISDPLIQALHTLYNIDHTPTGELGILKASREPYGVIVLDLSLPDRSGLAVCEALRNRGISAPILIISSETSVLTKIKLLDAGADDYLTKPFSLGELKARLRVLHRRAIDHQDTGIDLVVGELVLDRGSRRVSRSGVIIDLRPKEFAILECLMMRAGTVVSRDTLTRYAWDGGEDNWTNTIDVHIKHLRDKVDRPFEHPLIKTVHGIGYRLESSAAATEMTQDKAPATALN